MKKQRILSLLLAAALLFTSTDMSLYVRAEENPLSAASATIAPTTEPSHDPEAAASPEEPKTSETEPSPAETAIPETEPSPAETAIPETEPSPAETTTPEATETPEELLPTISPAASPSESPSENPSVDLDYVLGRPMTEEEIEEQKALVPNLPLMPKEEPVERYDSGLSFYAVMADKYDSRDYGYVTSVKNQNPWGSCWTYAAIASMESSLISAGESDASIDLSEWHLAYFSTHTGSDELGNTEGDYVKPFTDTTAYMNNGGNINMCIVALSNWKGAAREGDYPGTSDLTEMEGNTSGMTPADAWRNNAYRLENCYLTPIADTESVKLMIEQFGAVFSSYYHSNDCYNYDTAAYYYAGDPYTNHAITLVGWDDNYKKENFVSEPEGDGAWICKNSWGSNFGENGYFYISYYDASLAASNAAALEGKPVDEKMNNYYYGGGVAVGTYLYTTGIAQCYEAKANTSGAEQIEKVGFYTYSADVPYQIQVYKNPDNADGVVTNPETGEALLASPVSGTTSFAGYHTIELPQGIYIDEGDVFSVVVSFEETVKIPVDTTSSMQAQYSLLYDSVNITKAGESFVRPEGYPQYTDTSGNTDSGRTPRMNVITGDVSSNKLAEPQFQPQEGAFVRVEEKVTIDKDATVALSAESGADIYYTTDGSVPIVGVEGTLLYESPITIDKDMTIKAMSVKEGYRNSNVSEESYVACENDLLLSKAEITLTEGESAELLPLKLPTGKTAEDITWTSSDDTVAAYSDGVVSAATGKDGTAVIMATVPDHKGNIATADCAVTVKPIEYSVTFKDWDGSIIQTGMVASRRDAVPPPDPQKQGYDFTGWSGNYKNINRDEVITAIYTIRNYEITYYLDGGINAVDNPASYTIESPEIMLKEAGNKPGYLFDGWYLDAEYTEAVNMIPKGSQGDIALYAKWTEVCTQEGLWVEGIENQIYTGKAIKPVVKVYDGDTLLQEKKDYTVAYRNNTRVNESFSSKTVPTITISGKGNYTGKAQTTFLILPKDIGAADIFADDIILNYNKKLQKPVPTVTRGGKKLKNKTDYIVEYPDLVENANAYKEPGIYTILIKGKGGYTGERTVTLTIMECSFITKASVSRIPGQPYNGEEITTATMSIQPVVKYGRSILTEGVHYETAYVNNLNIGTATMILRGTGTATPEGTFVGEKKVTFKITGKSIGSAKVSGIPKTMVYTGEEITQKTSGWGMSAVLTMTAGGESKTLCEGTDYEVFYQKNTAPGTATIIFKGINGYSGSLRKTFKITAYDIKNDIENKITAEIENQPVYVKGGSRPEPVIKFGDTVLVKNKDYTLSYRNNTAANDGSVSGKEPVVIIKGKGKFKGNINLTYSIEKQDIGKLRINTSDVVYKNKVNAYKSIPEITDIDGKALRAGTDFEKTYSYCYGEDTELADGTKRLKGDCVEKNDVVPAGTLIEVAVVGKGNYTGTIKNLYRVTKADIGKAKITIQPQVYTGKEILLDRSRITAKYENGALNPEDYEIVADSYKNNINKGTASVTIRGIGNYGGTKTVKFTIKGKIFQWWWE